MGCEYDLKKVIELEVKVKEIKKLKTLQRIPAVIRVLDEVLEFLECLEKDLEKKTSSKK
ncbi:hypothetical protein ACO3VM_09485 (plasmid) [Methanocaldococcus sp. 10A]